MKLHRNAKGTPSSRLLLVRRVIDEGWRYTATAEGFAVSARTVAKRRARGVGWEHVHVAIDDHSRGAYVEVLNESQNGRGVMAI